MSESREQVVVEFPLRGEWMAANTPARRVPSHGTDRFGQRYAYDFVRVDSEGMPFHAGTTLHYLLSRVRLDDCYGWGQPIHSPVAGVVLQAEDGWPERQRLQPIKDLLRALTNGLSLSSKRLGDFRRLGGNHIIIETSGGYTLLAHARTGSITVSKGDAVEPGHHLADVGHSGNSTAPHLHFHMMDRPDLLAAQGVPCCFREYEALRDGTWTRVENGIPKHTEIIRSVV